MCMKKQDVLKRFGGVVRAVRLSRGMTQMKLAELVGCSLQSIGDIERGKANPSLYMVYRIAKALGVSMRDLIG